MYNNLPKFLKVIPKIQIKKNWKKINHKKLFFIPYSTNT